MRPKYLRHSDFQITFPFIFVHRHTSFETSLYSRWSPLCLNQLIHQTMVDLSLLESVGVHQ